MLFLFSGIFIILGLVLVVKSYNAFNQYRKEQIERQRAVTQNLQAFTTNQPPSQPQFEAPPPYNMVPNAPSQTPS